MSRALSLPPNPGPHKGTKVVHCRRPLVSAGLLKVPLARALNSSSCFIRMAQHWLLLSSFVVMSGIYLQLVIVKPAGLSTGFQLAS